MLPVRVGTRQLLTIVVKFRIEVLVMVRVLIVWPLMSLVIVLFRWRIPLIVVVLIALQIWVVVHILLLANVRLINRGTKEVVIVVVD